MKFAFTLALLHPLLSVGVVTAERKFPTDLQVDLIFPRNETYAPTQLLPIVFGLNNFDAVWPLDMHLTVRVRTLGWLYMERPGWSEVSVSVSFNDIQVNQFFHFPAINMTKMSNGTLDSFVILWDVSIPLQCLANDMQPGSDQKRVAWSDEPSELDSRAVEFRMASGAQPPNIEAAVSSCSERTGNDSAAIRVAALKTSYYHPDICTQPGAAIRPEKCVFKSAAKELAANVSAAMLKEMSCDEGDWWTIATPCPWKKSMALSQSAGFGVGWLLLALAFVTLNAL